MAVYRVLRTSKATLTRTFYLDEEATSASADVTVSATRWDGTVVQGPDTATGPDADSGYTWTFNGLDVLDELTLTWSATVGGDAIVLDQDQIQVVGGYYLGLSDIRSKIDPVFKDTTRYPTLDLIDRRQEVEDEFERICGQAFVPRFAVETMSGATVRTDAPVKLGWTRLRKVRAVVADGVSLGQDALDLMIGNRLGLIRDRGLSAWPYGATTITVEYEHGMDRAPSDIVRAFKLRMKSFLLAARSPLPDRAERIATTDIGVVQLAIARKDATGIFEVDAALERFPSPRPGFG